MVKEICKNVMFLMQKAQACTMEDISLGKDLLDTLRANKAACVGMAANMIGVNKAAIVVNMGMLDMVMFNPKILSRKGAFDTEEGCLSLNGTRKCTRYREIEVEFQDMMFKKQVRRFSGWTAQIIQHECDHLDGIII